MQEKQICFGRGANAAAFLMKNGAAALLIFIILFNSAVTPNFFAFGTLKNLIVQCFPILTIAMGMTAVVSSGGIDISVGSVMAASACIMSLTEPAGVIPCVLAGLAVGTFFGLFNGFFISAFDIQPTIMTLIMMIVARGFAQIIADGKVISLYSSPISDMATYKICGEIPVQLVIMIVFVLLSCFLFYRTTIGICVQAVGENERAARLVGISKVKSCLISYGLVGAMAALAGIFEAGRAGLTDCGTLGYLAEMDVIAAVVIGGTPMTGGKGRVIGSLFGSVIITLITITCNMNNISYYYGYILKSVIIILAVFLQQDRRER